MIRKHSERGWWVKPHWFRDRSTGDGCVGIGPIQVNWYHGLRVYVSLRSMWVIERHAIA